MAVDSSQQTERENAVDLDVTGPHGQLLDLLGARLQYEQNGIRLYDQLIAKLESEHRGRGDDGHGTVGPTVDDLMAIRNDELAHVRLLDTTITELGGEPAAVTPAASREVIASRGIADIVGDPASSLLDALEAMVVAELADHEQWVGLVELARELGRDDLARSFLTAQSTEHTHLSKMRAWISAERAARRLEVQ
jgi:rubrerythrin